MASKTKEVTGSSQSTKRPRAGEIWSIKVEDGQTSVLITQRLYENKKNYVCFRFFNKEEGVGWENGMWKMRLKRFLKNGFLIFKNQEDHDSGIGAGSVEDKKRAIGKGIKRTKRRKS